MANRWRTHIGFSHSATHSLSHSLTHSASHSLSHSLTQPLTHSLSHSLSQSASQSASQPASQPASQSLSQPASQSASQSLTQPVTQPASQPVSQPASQPATQPACQPVTQPVSQSASQAARQLAGVPDLQACWTLQQKVQQLPSTEQLPMEAPPLWLLLLLNSLMFMSAQVDVVVEPSTSQFFKYNRFSVSCGADEQEQEVTGWTVMKRTKDGEVRPCPASCVIIGAFPATDSGAYWCESGAGETSQTVNITVTAGSVVLDSPVHPVTEGQDVILTCRCNDRDSTCGLASTFYKDGVMAGSGVGRVLTLHNVSVCDEGFYACEIIGSGKSPESWLTVQGLPPAGRDPPALPDLLLLYHLLVGMPFLVCTLMVGLLYRDRAWRPGVPASWRPLTQAG